MITIFLMHILCEIMHFIGSYTDNETNETVDFDIIWKTSYDQGTTKYHYLYDGDSRYRLKYNLANKCMYAVCYNTNGTSKDYSFLQKQIDSLNHTHSAKIAALEARLAALEQQ